MDFSLTPALSRWAREKRCPPRTKRVASVCAATGGKAPSPAGEGWGEGDRKPLRRAHSISTMSGFLRLQMHQCCCGWSRTTQPRSIFKTRFHSMLVSRFGAHSVGVVCGIHGFHGSAQIVREVLLRVPWGRCQEGWNRIGHVGRHAARPKTIANGKGRALFRRHQIPLVLKAMPTKFRTER